MIIVVNISKPLQSLYIIIQFKCSNISSAIARQLGKFLHEMLIIKLQNVAILNDLNYLYNKTKHIYNIILSNLFSNQGLCFMTRSEQFTSQLTIDAEDIFLHFAEHFVRCPCSYSVTYKAMHACMDRLYSVQCQRPLSVLRLMVLKRSLSFSFLAKTIFAELFVVLQQSCNYVWNR